MIQERYIVDVLRIDGVWEYEMEHDGVTAKIPRAVFDKFMDAWAAIAHEGLRRRGKAQAESKRNGAKAEDPETDPDFAMVLGQNVDGSL